MKLLVHLNLGNDIMFVVSQICNLKNVLLSKIMLAKMIVHYKYFLK